MVALVHIQVIDIEQQAAAAAAHQFRQELRLAHGIVGKTQVSGDILQQDRPFQHILHPPHSGAQQIEGGAIQGQRQQIVELPLRHGAPAQVFRHEGGLDALGHGAHALQVHLGKTARGTQAQAHAMQADRVILAQGLQHMMIPARRLQIIFSVYFQPAHLGPARQEVAVVHGAQADAGKGLDGRRHGQAADAYGCVAGLAALPALMGLTEPPACSHVPLATYVHSVGRLSASAWPAQECAPSDEAQSFCPALATP